MRPERIDLDAEAILFVDDDLVAVDKAAGWLTDATRDPNRDHLGVALERWAHRTGRRADPLLPVHRLDLATSGVVLFARRRDAATELMTQFRDRSVSKEYQAVVSPPPGAGWEPGTTFERRSHLRHRRGRTEEVRAGGKVAETAFEVIAVAVAPPTALVRAMPRTGRTHQLRVQLAAVGAPILGDDLYGAAEVRAERRLWLHAVGLEFRHPRTGEPVEVRSRRRLALAEGTPVSLAVAH